MKKSISLIVGLISIIFFNCNSQKKSMMEIPKIDSSLEVFEKNKFSKTMKVEKVVKKAEDVKGQKKIKDKDFVTVYITSKSDSYVERDSTGKLIKFFSSGLGGNNEISGYDYSQNPIIGIYKEFYENGNIKTKGVYCWFGFKIGKWYNYDVNGNIIKVEDTDKGFSFSTNDIFLFAENRKISLEKKDGGKRTEILKYTDSENKSYWFIQYPDYEKIKYINIQIDGNNGKVVNTKELPFEEFEENNDH